MSGHRAPFFSPLRGAADAATPRRSVSRDAGARLYVAAPSTRPEAVFPGADGDGAPGLFNGPGCRGGCAVPASARAVSSSRPHSARGRRPGFFAGLQARLW